MKKTNAFLIKCNMYSGWDVYLRGAVTIEFSYERGDILPTFMPKFWNIFYGVLLSIFVGGPLLKKDQET